MEFKKGLKTLNFVLLALLGLVILKYIVGSLTNTHVLIADAMHSLSDLVALFIVYIGICLATRKPDEKFKYGYYKAETVAALLVSLFIIYVGIEIVLTGIFEEPKNINNPLIAAAVAFVSAFVSLVISKYERKVSEELNLQSLDATSDESYADFLSSIGVGIAIIFDMFGITILDKIITILLGVVIIKVGIENLIESVYSLMDVSPEEIEDKIRRTITRFAKLKELKLRKAGPFILGECTILVDPDIDVEEAHKLTEKIEKAVYKKFPYVQNLTIHIEPIQKEKLRILIPVDRSGKISEHFSKADYFVVYDWKKGKYRKIAEFENDCKNVKIKASLCIKKYLKGIDVVIAKNMGEISYNLLRAAHIKILKSKFDDVEKNLEHFNELEEFTLNSN